MDTLQEHQFCMDYLNFEPNDESISWEEFQKGRYTGWVIVPGCFSTWFSIYLLRCLPGHRTLPVPGPFFNPALSWIRLAAWPSFYITTWVQKLCQQSKFCNLRKPFSQDDQSFVLNAGNLNLSGNTNMFQQAAIMWSANISTVESKLSLWNIYCGIHCVLRCDVRSLHPDSKPLIRQATCASWGAPKQASRQAQKVKLARQHQWCREFMTLQKRKTFGSGWATSYCT